MKTEKCEKQVLFYDFFVKHLGGRRKFRGKPGIFLPLPKQEKSPGEGLELLPGGA
jgi:hypothetical protein